MRNRLYIVLIGLILMVGMVRAENVEHESILMLRFGGSWRQDQYLSPLLYKGLMVGIGNEWWQPFRKETKLGQAGKLDNWEHVGRLDVRFDWTYNPTQSNVLYALQLQTGWGANYVWRFVEHGVQVFVGPYLEVSGGIKYHIANVNKPISLDLMVSAQAMAGVSYAFKGKKTSYRLRYMVRFNLIGVDYMPDYWQSYYEMYEEVLGKVRCAGMWNHRTLHHELTLDMQFPHSTWRVGICHDYDEYGQKNMMFSTEQVAMVVGTCFRYKLNPKKDFASF